MKNETSLYLFKLTLQLFTEFANQLDNFVIGLTATSPDVQLPTYLNYAVCGQYPGSVAAGVAVSLQCQQNLLPYRYIIVQNPLPVAAVAVCELQVFLRCELYL
jgi:hypothetical protein